MDILAIFVTILGLSAWMGSSIFLTFFVTPVIQKRLGPSKMSEITDLLGSRFHWLGTIAAGVMLLGAGGALFWERIRLPAITFIGLTAIALILTLYVWLVIMPRTIALRERTHGSAGTEQNFAVREPYDQAMRLAAFLTFVVLLLLVAAAAALAAILSAVGNGPEAVLPPDAR